MTKNTGEAWRDRAGYVVTVYILRRALTMEDVCPECSGGLRIAVGKIADTCGLLSMGEQVFRLECIRCGWTSEALPDPEA